MMASPDAAQVGSVVTITALSNEKYVIGKILRGGMGEVYQLVPVAPIGLALALKTYQSSASRESFTREAEIWISLGNHPHIARAFAYLEWQSKPSIIASWYKQAVNNAIAREWSTTKIIKFTVGLIDGLEYAFNFGRVIHQDVKPDNILLDEEDMPRLADFGMARFAVRRQVIRSFVDVDTSMVHTVTLGPIGGTPFYMAPELFSGRPPSIQTDIFSLGVTLYEIITGEHPYCGPETDHRSRTTLRTKPLLRFRQTCGNEAIPLISVITAALQLDPGERPSSYSALLRLLGGRRNDLVANKNTVQDMIAKAGILRDTGRAQEAIELLRTALNDRPMNPELLNSYAIDLLKLGSKREAYSVWQTAVESLTFTRGRHDHEIYVDPVVNLAWRMVAEKQFENANNLFALINEWCKDAPHVLRLYMEYGWWHLYNGRFEDAWEHIVTCCSAKTPDEMSLWCFTLAGWLSGKFEKRADTLALAYSGVTKAGMQTALLACVVATCCSVSLRNNLMALAYPAHEDELKALEMEIGTAPGTFRRALPHHEFHLILRSLDVAITGGKNSELV